MEEVNGAFKHKWYEQISLNSLRVIPNVKVFATEDGRMDGRPDEHDS